MNSEMPPQSPEMSHIQRGDYLASSQSYTGSPHLVRDSPHNSPHFAARDSPQLRSLRDSPGFHHGSPPVTRQSPVPQSLALVQSSPRHYPQPPNTSQFVGSQQQQQTSPLVQLRRPSDSSTQLLKNGASPLLQKAAANSPLLLQKGGSQPSPTLRQVNGSPHSSPSLNSNHTQNGNKIKCVFIGDGAIGKTSLIISYTTNGYPDEYVPTAIDTYHAVVHVDGQPLTLELCDTPGQDDFDTLRPLVYPDTDVFLLCFSVALPSSFHNVREKWIQELKSFSKKVPVVLVGTQSDLREDAKTLVQLRSTKEQPVQEHEARKLAHSLGCETYVECSSLTQRNLKDVFDNAVVAGLANRAERERKKNKKKRKKLCVLL